MKRSILFVALVAACASEVEDGEHDRIFGDGKADSTYSEAELAAAVRVANELSRSELDDDVPLSSTAAKNIVAHRDGADGVLGTADDDPFDDLAELDGVPYVGPVAFANLVDFARTHGYVTASEPDREWAAWPIPSDDPPLTSYEVNGGIVTDVVTGLEWEQHPPTEPRSLGKAAFHCSSLSLGGGGWRLPTLVELSSLVSYGSPGSPASYPAINTTAFPDTQPSGYWTSTPYHVPTATWQVSFRLGGTHHVNTETAQNQANVRCVRSATPGATGGPGARYAVTDETVGDAVTGLTWQRTDLGADLPIADALSFCDALDLGGTTAWRLPTVKELQSLLDVRASYPSIDTVAFPGTAGEEYITSTAFAHDPTSQWMVRFGLSETLWGKTADYHVRCVH